MGGEITDLRKTKFKVNILGIIPRFLNFLRFNTTFALHNKATKVSWYKKWHDKKFSHYAHVGVLLVYVFSVFFAAFILPNRLYAALTEQNQQISSQAQFELGTLTDANASGDSIQLNSEGLSHSGGGDWNYRKKITIDNSAGGALTDYQVSVDSEKDMVGHWNMDETSGTTVYDSSWSGNDRTFSSGTPTRVAGRYGNALSFSSNSVGLGTLNPSNQGSAFTVSAWLKTTQVGTGAGGTGIFFSKRTGTNTFALSLNGGKIEVNDWGAVAGATFTGSVVVNNGSWHLITMAWDGTTSRLYVDGLLDTQKVINFITQSVTNGNSLGAFDSGATRPYIGLMDDVSAYNKNLTATEVYSSFGNTNYVSFFNRVKADGSDIRFTDSDGKTELSYWNEAFNNATTGKKGYKSWAKVPSIPAGTTKDIFMYYGNGSATTSSNSNIMEFMGQYDAGYNVGALNGQNGWVTDLSAGATANVVNSTYSTTPNSGQISFTGDQYGVAKKSMSSGLNAGIFETTMKKSVTTTHYAYLILAEGEDTRVHITMSVDGHFKYAPSGQGYPWTNLPMDTTYVANTWYRIKIIWKSNNTFDIYIDGVLKGSSLALYSPMSAGINTVKYVGGASSIYTALNINFDADYVGKYAETPPTIIDGGGLALQQYKKEIAFNTTATGADVATAQYDFPVAVHINSSSMPNATERSHFFGDYNMAGKRVQFWESDESIALDYEVEYYDQATQEAIYWVRVPKVDGNSTTDKIKMAYGRSPGADQDNKTRVWVNGYAMVQHLGANSWGTAPEAKDSTENANNGTNTGSVNSVGIANSARLFNGTSNKVSSSDSASLYSALGISVEAWAKPSITQTNKGIVGKWLTSSEYTLRAETNNVTCFNIQIAGVYKQSSKTTAIPNSSWSYLTGTYDGANVKMFINGGQAGADVAATGSITDTTEALTVGSYATTYFAGDVDEVRVSNVARSADWLKLTYYSTAKTSFNGDNGVSAPLVSYGVESDGNNVTFGFSVTGSYLSPANPNVIDMDWIGDGSWLTANPNFQATVTVPANTSIDFSARVGRDNAGSIVWDGTAGVGGWVDLGTADSTGAFTGSNTAWDSMPDDLDGYSWRYLQIQAEFNSDGNDTPILSDYTVTYGTDITDPVNPTASHVYTDSGKGTELTSNVSWTNDVTPYLEWTGASDGVGDSGVNCFYVYLGTDINADPETAGMEVGGNICHSGTNLDLMSVDTNPLTDAVSGEVYYLRVDTKDNAGNIADMPNGQAIFTYKFDDVAPTSPTAANKAPIGYSSINSYSFDWTDYVGTDDFSSIVKYQYKTGNPGATWVDIAGTSFTNLALLPIADGKNTIYIRAVDGAGNFSEDSASWYKDYFYFSANAPDEPQTLTVSPNSNTVNSFTFKWYKPANYTADGIKGYYYSVNEFPSAENSVYLADPNPMEASPGTQLSTGAIAAATRQGSDNTFYVVAVDTNDAVNYGNYSEISFEANTASPGIPGSASIADSSNRESSQWSLTIAWNASAGSVDHYNIYRSADGISWEDTPIATTSATGYFDSGLTQGETYYYEVTAVDNAGSESAPSTIVSDQPTGKYTTPPSIVSGPEATATAVGARITWSTDRPSSSFAEYSTDTSYNLSNGSLTPTTEHVVELSGLAPSNMYNFRVQSLDEERDYDPSEAYSQNYTLATSAAPGISDVKVSDTGLYSTIITWKTTSSATSRIKYGLSTSYGQEMIDESGSAVTTHTVKLDDLRHSTTYNFKITGIDTDNNYMESDNYVFSTLTFPTVSNVRFEQQKNSTTSTLKVTWESNVPLTSVVGYRLSDGGETKEASSSKLVIKHEMLVSGLKDNTTYYMTVEGRDAHGNLAVSDQNKVQTDFDTRPPEIFNVTTETEVTGYGLDSKGQIIVSWETDEPGTSQIEYGVGSSGAYTNKTQEDSALSTSHVVIVSELKTSSPYHFRVISSDASKNEGKSEEYSALTLQASRSVFDAILTALEGAIGWLFR